VKKILHFFKNNFLNITLVFTILILANIVKNRASWEKESRIFSYDVNSYYAYLPAAFIYKDIGLENLNSITPAARKRLWTPVVYNNRRCIKTSMGLSFLYAPFFLIAHQYALHSNYVANGYSLPYKLAITISFLFYIAIALFFLKAILLKYFSKTTTAITIVSVIFGTNLLYYILFRGEAVHSYNFSLIVVFVYLIIRWHENPNYLNSILIGLLGGLLVLIRPTNILIFLIFLLYKVGSYNSLKNRVLYFVNNYKKSLIIILSFLLVWIPQFIYWKYVTNKYLYFSYGSAERFFFNNPQIINGLFSYRNGWLLYTPIMIFSIIGIVLLRKKLNSFFVPISLFFITFIYIIFSWWCWWFVGFGNRAMIGTYGVLAIPFAVYIETILKKKWFFVTVNFIIIGFLIFLNSFQVDQYKRGIIHYDGMTKKAYWTYFLKYNVPLNKRIFIESPDYKLAHFGIYKTNHKYRQGRYSYKLDSLHKNSQIRYFSKSIVPKSDSVLLSLTINVLPEKKLQPNTFFIKLWLYENDTITKNFEINTKNLKLNVWNKISFSTTFDYNSFKRAKLLLHHEGLDSIFVDRLKYKFQPLN